MQEQEISLHTPHPRRWRDFQPNPLPQGERGLGKSLPSLDRFDKLTTSGRGRGEG